MEGKGSGARQAVLTGALWGSHLESAHLLTHTAWPSGVASCLLPASGGHT